VKVKQERAGTPPIILTLADYYLPGHKAGGALRSVANLVARLGDRFRFRIITRDRDLGDDAPYPGVEVGRWTRVGRAEVMYLPPENLGIRDIRRVLSETPADVLYLNSFFSVPFAVLPLLLRRAGVVPRTPVILAPRGKLSDGCLAVRPRRKRIYRALAFRSGLLSGVRWQASTELEEADIRTRFRKLPGGSHLIRTACDLPASTADQGGSRTHRKVRGHLRLLFVSRIHRVKNLAVALEVLQDVRGRVEFDIYGPCEDADYWEECLASARTLPSEISFRYLGALPHAEIPAVMREHDLFILPSDGENYGHVIHEALVAGCPVLISDRTPWRGLAERGAGWDVELTDTHGFTQVLQRLVDMDEAEHATFRAGAASLGLEQVGAAEAVAQNVALFTEAVRDASL
jgi:glycosyltransferase involved in cell wall biosynthesis